MSQKGTEKMTKAILLKLIGRETLVRLVAKDQTVESLASVLVNKLSYQELKDIAKKLPNESTKKE